MLPQELIRRKRDGGRLADDELGFLVRGIADGGLADAQVGAFAMAAWLNGLDDGETVALTLAMRDSGTVLAWDLPGPVLDKHSTGGIGDKVSLVLAPLVAACGGFVPMISGRGLGHTGGTLDKLESIPGYRATPGLADLRKTVRDAGCAIIGQTAELAPADRRLYAIRDVTATVESIPLITASILAKKLAAGLHGLVMDVKAGSGAFLPGLDDARALAGSIERVAKGAGLACTAFLTDMGQCLGGTAGNALEVREALAMLRGEPVHARLREVTLALTAELLVVGGLASDAGAAHARAEAALASGAAAERFARMAHGLGGPADLVERHHVHLRRAAIVLDVHPERAAAVALVDARALGLAIVALGGGRTRPDQTVDHTVGLDEVAAIGDRVGPDRALCRVHAADREAAENAARAIRAAFKLADVAPGPAPSIIERLGHGLPR